MTENDRYGLGIERFSGLGERYGHGGGVPGSSTLVIHPPATGKTAVWVTTNDRQRSEAAWTYSSDEAWSFNAWLRAFGVAFA
jgi:hypothetical protein